MFDFKGNIISCILLILIQNPKLLFYTSFLFNLFLINFKFCLSEVSSFFRFLSQINLPVFWDVSKRKGRITPLLLIFYFLFIKYEDMDRFLIIFTLIHLISVMILIK